MSFRNISILAAMAFVLFLINGTVQAGNGVLPISVKVDKAAQDVTFSIDFPHSPDFFKVDNFNRPADSFQIEISADPARGDPLANLTTIIRGDEIQYGKGIVIRNASPPDLSDPHAAGWGTASGPPVPFSLKGNDLTFTAPFSSLGTPEGTFAYRAFSLEFGAIQAENTSESVPLPAALPAMLAMIAVGVFARRLQFGPV